MELNKIRFKNGGLYLDDTKVNGIKRYELTDGTEKIATLRLELYVDGDELFKEEPEGLISIDTNNYGKVVTKSLFINKE